MENEEIVPKIPKRLAAVEVQKKLIGQILISFAGMVLIFMVALTPSQCFIDAEKIVCAIGALKLIISALGAGVMLVALVRAFREERNIATKYDLPKFLKLSK